MSAALFDFLNVLLHPVRAVLSHLARDMPQVEVCHEICKLVTARPEKGTAEYPGKAYPDIKGFSPRNLRRMRNFYRACQDAPEVLAEAMSIGWTQNMVIPEVCESLEEWVGYIRGAAIRVDEGGTDGKAPHRSTSGNSPRLRGGNMLY